VEAVTLRLRARVPADLLPAPDLPEGPPDPAKALLGKRALQLDALVPAPVYQRARLLAGNVLRGPAIVTQLDSTTLIPPGWQAVVDRYANLVIERC
jgi:N-methylhydantoinase A